MILVVSEQVEIPVRRLEQLEIGSQHVPHVAGDVGVCTSVLVQTHGHLHLSCPSWSRGPEQLASSAYARVAPTHPLSRRSMIEGGQRRWPCYGVVRRARRRAGRRGT